MTHDSPRIDSAVAHPARRYNYWLGGKDNFAADRASGDAIEKVFRYIRTAAKENRAFLQRAVRVLIEADVRQFLDIGTGLPTADNTHEVAQHLAPDARVVYVDNDHSKSGCAHTSDHPPALGDTTARCPRQDTQSIGDNI